MRAEKLSLAAEIEQWVSGTTFVIAADYRGLKVEQMKDLRARLGAAGAQMHVVKNRLLKRVAAAKGWTPW